MKKKFQELNFDFYIRGIGHSMRYANDQGLAGYNITNQQARLLGEIYDRLESNVEISRRILSKAMRLSGPSVTSLLNGLEKNGFIIRHTGNEDGRTMQIEITSKAMKFIDETNDIFTRTEEKLLCDFTEEEKEIFLELLKKAYKNIT